MKWYFCLSQLSIDRAHHGWIDLVYAAVLSAKQNTTLNPFMLFDGDPCEFTRDIEALGVAVIFARVSFYESLEARAGGDMTALGVMAGCYLRTQIPNIEKEDQFILYTDCDVLFQSDPRLDDVRPEVFSVAPEADINNYEYMNSGVMVMNCVSLRRSYDEFERFIVENPELGLDQDHYRIFYQGQWAKLDPKFNWKPYWGKNDDASIVHWHGPKPVWVQGYFSSRASSMGEAWAILVQSDINGYWHFLSIQKKYSRNAELHGFVDLRDRISPICIKIEHHENGTIGGVCYNKNARDLSVDVDVLVDFSYQEKLNIVFHEYIDLVGYRFSLLLHSDLMNGDISFLDKAGRTVLIHVGDDVIVSLKP